MKPYSKEQSTQGYVPGPKKKQPIPKVSKKRQSKEREYQKLRRAFLEKNPVCQVKECRRFANDVHHKKARIGDLLTDVSHFMAVCRLCHQKIELNPKWAIENGYSVSRLAENDDREIYE